MKAKIAAIISDETGKADRVTSADEMALATARFRGMRMAEITAKLVKA